MINELGRLYAASSLHFVPRSGKGNSIHAGGLTVITFVHSRSDPNLQLPLIRGFPPRS